MTQSIVPLNKNIHANLTFSPVEDYSFCADVNLMPLLFFEVVEAARHFPIVFSKRTGMPHALLGLGSKNVFVDEHGHWTAPYIPLSVANYPFSLIDVRSRDTAEKFEPALAIDENAPHFHQENGARLYDEHSEPTELLQKILTAMANQYRRHHEGEQSLNQLFLCKVLQDKVVAVRHKGVERMVGGLHVADRDKIMALSDRVVSRWAKNGLIELLFAHWQSMRNLVTLLDDPSCPKNESMKKQ